MALQTFRFSRKIWLVDAPTRVDRHSSESAMFCLVTVSPPCGFNSDNYQATGDSCWHLSINGVATHFSNWCPQRWKGGEDAGLERSGKWCSQIRREKRLPTWKSLLKTWCFENSKRTHTHARTLTCITHTHKLYLVLFFPTLMDVGIYSNVFEAQ